MGAYEPDIDKAVWIIDPDHRHGIVKDVQLPPDLITKMLALLLVTAAGDAIRLDIRDDAGRSCARGPALPSNPPSRDDRMPRIAPHGLRQGRPDPGSRLAHEITMSHEFAASISCMVRACSTALAISYPDRNGLWLMFQLSAAGRVRASRRMVTDRGARSPHRRRRERLRKQRQTRASVPCPVASNAESVSAVTTPLRPTVNLTIAG